MSWLGPGSSSVGCGHSVTRRGFVKGCATGLALTAGLAPSSRGAGTDEEGRKVRVALVFLSRPGSSWPSPVFDVARREKEVLDGLRKGCPEVEFVPVVVRAPGQTAKAVALRDQVDGYLVYMLTLTWGFHGALMAIAKLGKPLVVADEILGGSGTFLTTYSSLVRQGVPVVGVASSRLDDLVAVARCFAALKEPGTTPASFAQLCRQTYRKTFAAARELKCLEDRVEVADIGKCVERFKRSRFLIVGRGRGGQRRNFLGAEGIYVGFEELKALYEKVDPDEAAAWADRWSKEAEKILDARPEWIRKAAAIYLALCELLKRYDTDSVTINCLGGFASRRLPAYPCLAFRQLLNDGGHGVCEAMPDDTLSMLMGRILTGRPGYVSDPVLDTSRNHIIYAHCMATTKVFGPKGPSNPFHILTLHNRDQRSTAIRSLLPAGYMTTSFRTNFARKLLVVHQAKAVGNLCADRGCRTQLVGEVRGDIARLFHQWDVFGWHRVTVYGDIKEPLVEFAKALGLRVVEEA